MGEERDYGIAELAELAGVSRRTVRYYVRRGLLEPPLGAGRGSRYTEAHLTTLQRIRRLQEAGVSLADIPAALGIDGEAPASVAPIPRPRSTRWSRVLVADGVELHVREALLEPELVRRMGEALARILKEDP